MIREARFKASKKLYCKLETMNGKKDIYKIEGLKERKTRDLTQVKCTKDENKRILVMKDMMKERWS